MFTMLNTFNSAVQNVTIFANSQRCLELHFEILEIKDQTSIRVLDYFDDSNDSFHSPTHSMRWDLSSIYFSISLRIRCKCQPRSFRAENGWTAYISLHIVAIHNNELHGNTLNENCIFLNHQKNCRSTCASCATKMEHNLSSKIYQRHYQNENIANKCRKLPNITYSKNNKTKIIAWNRIVVNEYN